MTVESAAGNWAILSGYWDCYGSNLLLQDFEFTAPHDNFSGYYYVTEDPHEGLSIYAPNSNVRRLIVHHNGGDGINVWNAATDTTVDGCILYYNGAYDPSVGQHRPRRSQHLHAKFHRAESLPR